MKLMQRRIAATTALLASFTLALVGCSPTGGGGGGGGGTGTTAANSLTPAPVCATDLAKAPAQLGSLPDGPNESVKGKVTLWGWYNVAPQSTLALMKQYYPNVELEFVDYSLSDTPVKVQTAINAGTGAPDLAMIEDKVLPVLWDAGLYDLKDCLAPYKDSFPQFKWGRITRQDGAQVAVPWEINPGLITYRRDVFEKYGIDPESIKTWDDYIEVGKRVTAESNGEVQWLEANTANLGSGTTAQLTGDIALLVNQAGGQFFDQDGKAAFNNPETLKALTLVKRLKDEGLIGQDFTSKEEEATALREGKVATMLVQASSRFFMSSALEDTAGEWGLFQMPAFEAGGPRGAVDGGTSIVMPAQGENSEAAWAFLRIWLLSIDGRYESFKVGQLVENVFLPAAEDSRFQAPDPFYGGDSFLDVSIKASQDAPPSYSSAKRPQMMDAITANIPALMDGSLTPEQFAEKVQAAGQ